MKTYIINLSNGHKLSLDGDSLEMGDEGLIQLRSGSDTYFFFRESVLYWTVSNGTITDRQLQILALMAEGKTNMAIARTLGYSESTIRQESMEIYRTLGVSSREDAVAAALDQEILQAAA